MDEPDSTYAPQSPDFSAYNAASSSSYLPPAQSNNHMGFRDNFAPHTAVYHSSPYFNQQPQPSLNVVPPYHNSNKNTNIGDNDKKRRQVKEEDDDEYMPDASSPRTSRSNRVKKADMKSEEDGTSGTNPVFVKTKFPVARIKRIMQADEDVGKVAQVTPVIVCKQDLALCSRSLLIFICTTAKALELFMISLVCKSAQEAGSRSQKRITAAHLKQAIAKDEQFDFLQDIIAKVPDAPASGEKTDEGEDGAEARKKKVGRKKRKVSEEL
ncbi:hypothetical protein FGG08_000995 [Glutinoglossum americanum]|uniref:Transcription factor CBF/NF-Y/archaeal histone domain-containing protein n=1 Tax=Glutinoglossum americanum TaxID=1670608 RepID=A0A9P8IBY8_9PEZI|nr:hypothetical protein FGG08_000995 [Glutinoglossum americanum]